MTIEQRVSRLEGAYEQVDSRLDELSRSMNILRTDGLRAEMNESINGLLADLNSRLNIMLVIIAASG